MEPGSLRESPAGSGGADGQEWREDSSEPLEIEKEGKRGGEGDGENTEAGERDADGPEGEQGADEEDIGQQEDLDPRIQLELEHLNQASEEINSLELQLDEARSAYRKILTDSARKLNAQGSQLGACIEKARPYYEARRLAKEAQQETQKAALSYERAVSMHNAAREMVYVAEQGLMADRNRLDPTWQEMLNHATSKVNEAEEERLCSEKEHQRVTQLCQQAEARVQNLQKSLKRVIVKSKPYFELKAQFNHILEEHKSKVLELERKVSQVKLCYSLALRNLEQISEQIHARRGNRKKRDLSQPMSWEGRGSPVGAESEAACLPIPEAGVGGAGFDVTSPSHHLDSADNISVLSLQTIASDLQKFDSVQHLGEIECDATSLHSDDLGRGQREGSRDHRGQEGRCHSPTFLKHHRSISL
ncbi:SH3 domain-binding protein 5-like [Polyodon spathula]|uniref:SH3 domain-binding protein 5-like n=1 Tax=Polyodon spathula TaxID=7913 RepID=UPI001B7E4246|nr:SH3 domain-binding protein 5-like [Polyodon spathula]